METDFPEIREVDLKLIELARRMSGKIVTNDFNLNKVAQLRGVAVLNINELANSLKPVVLPGELMQVFIIKEGKEQGQGVAYLDDGTMVVVDQARKALGKTIDVSVSSVLQTTAGKMIFCRWPEAGAFVEEARRDIRPASGATAATAATDRAPARRRAPTWTASGVMPASGPSRPGSWRRRREAAAAPNRARSRPTLASDPPPGGGPIATGLLRAGPAAKAD